MKSVWCWGVGLTVFCLLGVYSHAPHSHGDHAHEHTEILPSIDSFWNVWVPAISASIFIGLAPIVVLPFVPLNTPGKLKIFLAFAVGGLIGDVFLHLLPHAIEADSRGGEHHHGEHADDSHHHHHHHGSLGTNIIVGIMVFFVIDKVVRSFGDGGHSHGVSDHKKTDGDDIPSHHKAHSQDYASRFLNLAADFAHNFTDGLAIGSAFASGDGIAFSTVLAILLHEIPHEVGDFAILVNSGVSLKNAMLLQGGTAIGAVVGTILGILIEGAESEASWILPFTAGGFLYISTVSVIPHLLEGTNGSRSSKVQSLLEFLAICVGIGFMALICLFE